MIFPTLGNKERITGQETKPVALDVCPNGIPSEMRAARRWVVWRFERVEDRWTKVPYCAASRQRASSTKSSSWSDFETALAEYQHGAGLDGVKWNGIGFVLGDGWAGVDLDDCRDPESGALTKWAEYILTRFKTFADVSPTSSGVKPVGVVAVPGDD
jgi:primase-polymerase (primpol)-like protein